MTTERFSTQASTTLAASIESDTLSISVQGTTHFPVLPEFRVRIGQELLLITGVSGATWTVTRGIEGTTAAGHIAGTPVVAVLTAGALDEMRAEIEAEDRTASGIRTASTVVAVAAATAPTAGQVLTATSGTAADWETPGIVPTAASLGLTGVQVGQHATAADTRTEYTCTSSVGSGVWVPRASQRKYVSKYECLRDLQAILGAANVSVYFPDDSVLSGANVTSIPGMGVANTVTARGSGAFTLKSYHGRKLLTNAINSGKSLQTSTGSVQTILAAIVLAGGAGTFRSAVAATTDGNLNPQLMVDTGNAWYSTQNNLLIDAEATPLMSPASALTTLRVVSITNAVQTGLAIGGITAAARDWIGDIGIVCQINAAITADQAYEASRIIHAYYNDTELVPLILDGDSLTADTWSSTVVLPTYYTRTVLASGGQTAATRLAAIGSQEYIIGRGAQKKVCAVDLGTNDLANGTSGATTLALIYQYCDYMRSQGWIVQLGNIMARDDTGWSSAKEIERGVVNAGIASTGLQHADQLISFTSDARLLNPNDTTYFNADKLHLNTTGYAVRSAIVAAGLATL